MRDTDRIKIFMDMVEAYWEKYCPDWRFMQLICNLQSYYGSDMFYVEEDMFVERLDNYCRHIIHPS